MSGRALEKENQDLRLQLGAIVFAARQADWRTVADECAGLEVELVDGYPTVPPRPAPGGNPGCDGGTE